MLDLQTRKPPPLTRPPQVGLRPLRQGHAPVRVAAADRRLLAARGQPLQPELPHRLEHAVAPLDIRSLVEAHEAAVNQRGHPLKNARAVAAAAHRLCPVQRPAADEDREALEEVLLLGGEQIMAPGDRVPHRALPLRRVPGAAGEQLKPLLQPGEHRLERQYGNSASGQLDRQRESVETRANGRHRRGVGFREGEVWSHSLGSRDEQAHRL